MSRRNSRYYAQNPDRRLAERHGPGFDLWWATAWRDQAGRCYLCGRQLTKSTAVVDHDHRCCPRFKSCARCRRGLACHACNVILGLARDDAALLRRIAENFEPVLLATGVRLSSQPQRQLAIGE